MASLKEQDCISVLLSLKEVTSTSPSMTHDRSPIANVHSNSKPAPSFLSPDQAAHQHSSVVSASKSSSTHSSSLSNDTKEDDDGTPDILASSSSHSMSTTTTASTSNSNKTSSFTSSSSSLVSNNFTVPEPLYREESISPNAMYHPSLTYFPHFNMHHRPMYHRNLGNSANSAIPPSFAQAPGFPYFPPGNSKFNSYGTSSNNGIRSAPQEGSKATVSESMPPLKQAKKAKKKKKPQDAPVDTDIQPNLNLQNVEIDLDDPAVLAQFVGESELVDGNDRTYIPDYIFLSIAQLKPCFVTPLDRIGTYKSRQIGFKGMCCKHCGGEPGFGRYFPETLRSLSQTTTSQTIVKHIAYKCRKAPKEIRNSVRALKELQEQKDELAKQYQRSRFEERPKYGSRKVFFQRLWGRLHEEQAVSGHGHALGIAVEHKKPQGMARREVLMPNSPMAASPGRMRFVSYCERDKENV